MCISIISHTTTNHQEEEPPVRVVLSLSLYSSTPPNSLYINAPCYEWKAIDEGRSWRRRRRRMVADRPRGKGKRTAKFKSNFDVEGGREDTEKVGTNRRIVTQSRL